MKPRPEREALRHTARVFLTEARRRKGSEFSQTLLQWACNARRRAMSLVREPKQQELF